VNAAAPDVAELTSRIPVRSGIAERLWPRRVVGREIRCVTSQAQSFGKTRLRLVE